MTADLSLRPRGAVARVQRATRDRTWGHRMLHRELAAGNPYAHRFLAARGLEYRDGAITRMEGDGARGAEERVGR